MTEVLAILRDKLERLKVQEADIRRENMKLQDRSDANAEHLASVVKQVAQFKEALEKLEA
jgi:hypothetical protein